MDNPKVVKGVKIGALIMSLLSSVATVWVTTKENKQNIDDSVKKYMEEHKEPKTDE